MGERGTEKHEIYAAASSGHIFYDLVLQGRGRGAMAPSPSLDPLLWIFVYALILYHSS